MAKDEDKVRFRALWSNFPTGVSVISFFTPDRAIHGITANSVCSVSLDPLLILVCVDHKARSFPMLDASDRFVMNFLAQGQEDQSDFFASSKTEGAGPFSWGKTASGLPTLDGALGFLVCLRVPDSDSGGPVVAKLDIAPPERGGFGAAKHRIPHDADERDIDGAVGAAVRRQLGRHRRRRASRPTLSTRFGQWVRTSADARSP